jgi:hypothetical protein
MRRMTVSIAGFIVLVIPLLGQTLRKDAATSLGTEWKDSPAQCVKALKLVVEEQCPVCGLKELKKGVKEDSPQHALQVYDEAYKFDDFWVLVATAPAAADNSQAAKSSDDAPDPERDCPPAKKAIEDLYGRDIPTLDKVRTYYLQKNYLRALYWLLAAQGDTDDKLKTAAGKLTAIRACYASSVKANGAGVPRLFQYVEDLYQ